MPAPDNLASLIVGSHQRITAWHMAINHIAVVIGNILCTYKESVSTILWVVAVIVEQIGRGLPYHLNLRWGDALR